MPLAKLVFDTFWSSTNPSILARFLTDRGFALTDATVPPPRRPIADAGPDRLITRGATTLSAEASLDANAFQWSIVSRPTDATLINPNSARPTFNATLDGNYVVRLIASNGAVQSSPDFLTLESGGRATAHHRLRQYQTDPGAFAYCDSPPAPHRAAARRNAKPAGLLRGSTRDALARPTVDAFYAEVRSRINFTDIVASPLLRKPIGLHHGGGSDRGIRLPACRWATRAAELRYVRQLDRGRGAKMSRPRRRAPSGRCDGDLFGDP